MNIWRKLQNTIRALLQKPQLDTEMNEEMRSHIEMRTQENIEAGMNSEEARFAALRQFGWTESIKETCREQRGVNWIQNLGQDVRYGARILRKNPGFATTAFLTVAIGIGSCTALFSVVNGVLLRLLRLPDPEQIVAIGETTPPNRQSQLVAPAAYLDWVKQASVFAHLAVHDGRSYKTRLDGHAVNLGGQAVTASRGPTLSGTWLSARRGVAGEQSGRGPKLSRLAESVRGPGRYY
jgi:putative ABC transport system permease protein